MARGRDIILEIDTTYGVANPAIRHFPPDTKWFDGPRASRWIDSDGRRFIILADAPHEDARPADAPGCTHVIGWPTADGWKFYYVRELNRELST